MRGGARRQEVAPAAVVRALVFGAALIGAQLDFASPAGAQGSWDPVVAPAKAGPKPKRTTPKAAAAIAKPVTTSSLPAPAASEAAGEPVIGPAFESFMGQAPMAVQAAQARSPAPIATASAEPRKPAVDAPMQPTFSTSAARQYCVNIADAAADARFAYQKKALLEMAQELEMRVGLLEEKIAEFRQWVTRRDEFVKKARDSLVLIYGRMKPDAAALQLVAMDEETAAAVLLKLDARIASTILNEMEPTKAARLTATISGAAKEPPGAPAPGNAGAGKS